jgi:threonine dehydrogenase-like Zn-dependent dehydrogenase
VKAAVFHGPHDVRIEDVAEPAEPARGDVVLEVLRAAICGTDASEWDHGPILCRPGVVLGHEFVARVEAVGADVEDLHVGDRVVSGAGVSCGRCAWCRAGRTNLCAEYRTLGLQLDGGLAEYVTSPASICRAVPDQVDDDAAAMTQPLAVALHALSRVALQRDERVAVIGVGGIGSFIVAVDIDPQRLATAAALGASEAVDATDRDLGDLLLELTDGVGFDVVIEATGAPHAPAAAVRGTRRGGRALFVGLHGAARELELTPMILREVDVFTTVAHVCDTDIPAALALLAESSVASVTAGPRIPLEELVPAGLQPLAERRATGKILVSPR